MAEEKKTPAKVEPAKKLSWWQRLGRWFKALPGRIAKAFANMAAELRKVSWPTKEKMISCSVTVLVFMLVMAVVIGLLDMGASKLVELLVL